MSGTTNAVDVVSVATLVVNALAFVVTAVMASLTWRNISLLTRQITTQAQGDIFDAHKDLFIQILSNDTLCSTIAGAGVDEFRRNMLASILINHCARIFLDYEADILRGAKLDEFTLDASGMFAIDIVKERWPHVKAFHSENFRTFIDAHVLHTSMGDVVFTR